MTKPQSHMASPFVMSTLVTTSAFPWSGKPVRRRSRFRDWATVFDDGSVHGRSMMAQLVAMPERAEGLGPCADCLAKFDRPVGVVDEEDALACGNPWRRGRQDGQGSVFTIKGPDDKALVVRDTVFALRR
jgi:hypothetical protein